MTNWKITTFQFGKSTITGPFFIANCNKLPEGKPPFSYGFPMVFPLKPPFSREICPIQLHRTGWLLKASKSSRCQKRLGDSEKAPFHWVGGTVGWN